MRIKGIALFAIALAVPAVAAAAEGGAEGNERNQRLVCRQSSATGSILRAQRICRTQAEWDAMAERDRDRRDQVRQRTNMTGSIGVSR